jgi:hypothetical protein
LVEDTQHFFFGARAETRAALPRFLAFFATRAPYQ